MRATTECDDVTNGPTPWRARTLRERGATRRVQVRSGLPTGREARGSAAVGIPEEPGAWEGNIGTAADRGGQRVLVDVRSVTDDPRVRSAAADLREVFEVTGEVDDDDVGPHRGAGVGRHLEARNRRARDGSGP